MRLAGFSRPNRWDILVAPLTLALIALLAWGVRGMTAPFEPEYYQSLSLDPLRLPEYGLRTVLRMACALAVSLLFTFTYGSLCAKSRQAEKVLVPLLDILQSVPILGFLAITVTGFMALFPGNLLGAELASIFAIFTSQAWNMAFSFYQSLKTVPRDLVQVAHLLGLSPWQRFWRLEVPFAIPGLVWNTMMSVSGGWFFVVASEAIAVGATQIQLPGIGSYVAEAIRQRDLQAVGLAILTMLTIIIIYDQLFFRPLVAWSKKFKFETLQAADEADSWVLNLIRRTRVLQAAARYFGGKVRETFLSPRRPASGMRSTVGVASSRLLPILFWLCVVVLAVLGVLRFYFIALEPLGIGELLYAFYLGLLTMIRVFALLLFSCLIWVPVGVFVGLRPKLAASVQALVQFLPAFPANLLFPVAVILIRHFDLTPEVFTAPLMALGAQWYILFNVIAGASALPTDMKEAASSLGVSGVLRWKRLILPAILPYLTTGLIAASGGTWNASIVAEVVSWGDETLSATGLGSYIAFATEKGDIARVLLGVAVMSCLVVTVERLVWRRLYTLAEMRFRLD